MLELTLASPCEEKWEAMPGDERARHCSQCQLTVFNVKNLSERETLELLAERGVRVCARLYQRPDGTVLTRDCPVGLARARRKLVAGLSAATALVLCAFGLRGPTACPSSPDGGSLANRVKYELAQSENWLRASSTFGPIVEWVDPAPRVKMGKVALVSKKGP